MRIVNKKKFIRSILTLILILLVAFTFIIQIFSEKENVKSSEIEYTISRGERLWDIAEEYKRPDQDIREYIYEIKKLNNMDTSTVYEGQTIKIIVYEEAE
ncbi:MAG: LysM peptidoglycan-binding domain-containing protein [Clostridia bacterium]|nr:LysM peptidoglycan-binding domain-containing protein [Clostridia bacterium]